MIIVCNGDNLPEMSNSIFWRKKLEKYHQSSAEFDQGVVKMNV